MLLMILVSGSISTSLNVRSLCDSLNVRSLCDSFNVRSLCDSFNVRSLSGLETTIFFNDRYLYPKRVKWMRAGIFTRLFSLCIVILTYIFEYSHCWSFRLRSTTVGLRSTTVGLRSTTVGLRSTTVGLRSTTFL